MTTCRLDLNLMLVVLFGVSLSALGCPYPSGAKVVPEVICAHGTAQLLLSVERGDEDYKIASGGVQVDYVIRGGGQEIRPPPVFPPITGPGEDQYVTDFPALGPGRYEVTVSAGVTSSPNGSPVTKSATFPPLPLIVLKVESLLPDNIEREVDDGDGNSDTRLFVVDISATAGDVVTVTATPFPNVAEADLPSCWTLTGGIGVGKLQRTIDRTTPSKTVLKCECGTSGKETTVYVVACRWSALADAVGAIGHAWWHFEIEPDSAIDGVIRKIQNSLTPFVDQDGGFYPVITGSPILCPGKVVIGPQVIGSTTNVHAATAGHDWEIEEEFKFATLLSGLTECRSFWVNSGTYNIAARNCVYGVCRIGRACPVANPEMHAFNCPDFWTTQHINDWLETLP
ncbi:MAG: hypothetical protein QME60_01215 [Verrucomicrobiota bacterium]|nr:hypothetical protein [Verrucomicrobiota bacterium]